MILISKGNRHVVLLTVFQRGGHLGTRADAEEAESVQTVVELNKKALAAYANLDVEEATKLLKQALEICGTAHLDDHLVAARTHVHIGVVYVAGLKQRDQGMEGVQEGRCGLIQQSRFPGDAQPRGAVGIR